MGPFAIAVLQNLPALIAAGADVAGLVTEANGRIATAQAEKRDPTPADWDWLNGEIRSLQGRLHAPGT